VLSDWSMGATQGSFRRAIKALDKEISANGTYGRISGVQYDSNVVGSGSSLWVNPSMAVILSESLVGLLIVVAERKHAASVEALSQT